MFAPVPTSLATACRSRAFQPWSKGGCLADATRRRPRRCGPGKRLRRPAGELEADTESFVGDPCVRSPTTGCNQIGSAQDPGSTSSVSGRDPGVERIYATAQSIGDIVGYYQRTYLQYRFTQSGVPVPQKQLFGRDGWAYISITVSPGQPNLGYGLESHIKLSPAPPTATTYVLSGRLWPRTDSGNRQPVVTYADTSPASTEINLHTRQIARASSRHDSACQPTAPAAVATALVYWLRSNANGPKPL